MKFFGLVFLITSVSLACAAAQADVLVQKTAGRPADKHLKIKKSGVPQYEISQNKKGKIPSIPRLDIGEEPSLAAGSLTLDALPLTKTNKLPNIEKKPSPTEISIKKWLNEIKPASNAQNLNSTGHTTPKAFTAPPDLPAPLMKDPQLSQINIKDLSPAELKLLQALIFMETQKNYPVALGLLSELLKEAPQMRTETTYHLALAAKGVGLNSEYRAQMLKVFDDKQSSWKKLATQSLVINAAANDTALVAALDPVIEKEKLDIKEKGQYQLNRAKYYSDEDQLKTAMNALDKISKDSSLYLDGQFLKGILFYKTGKIKEGTTLVASALEGLEKDKPDSELKSVAALTLARLQFQTGDYKTAFRTYLKVGKNHPEWPQAMIEQAWAQILSGDYEGAAGNMFSLHTDFFKNTFAPESYIVRAVSYLNLCQFGDGARVVTNLKHRYAPAQAQMQTYQAKHKGPLDAYETVKAFLKNADSKEIDGLPRPLIWQLARHPAFLTEQQEINSLEEEITAFNNVSLDLLKREKFLLDEQNKIREKIVAMKKDLKPNESLDEIDSLEKRLISYNLQHGIIKKLRTSMKDVRSAGLARIDKEKTEHKKMASAALTNRLSEMLATLTTSLDQTDVLQYELFAGAGEHLRYQAAGGEIKPTENPGLKPEENKQLKWEFKGEVWEDELGHYRSSLKNVCPSTDGRSPQVSSNENQ